MDLNLLLDFDFSGIDWANLVLTPTPATKEPAKPETTPDLVYRGGATIEPLQPARGIYEKVNLNNETDERTQLRAKGTTPTPAPTPATTPSPTATPAPASPASVRAANENIKTTADTQVSAAESPVITNASAVANRFTSASITAQTREERMDELQRTREQRMASEAMSRAQNNPMANYAIRPDAPEADDDFIYYYSWIGGVNTGNWRLYRAPNTPENMAKYGSRAIGGDTQATASSAAGANALKVQPKPDVDKDGKITGYTDGSTGGTSTAESSDSLYDAKRAFGYGMDAAGNQYRGAGTTADLFTINGKPFTGTWQGKTYKNGILTTTSGTKTDTSGTKITDGLDTNGTTGTASNSTDVLKAMLRGMGFNSSIIDASTSFLSALLKDGLDYDNAVAIFLNSKDYTTKNGVKLESPFYAEYGYLNEGLVRPKTPAELYNAVEGYKEISDKYKLNSKFVSKDYLKQYVKNNVTVAQLDERANTARLKAINSDPAYLESLRQLKFISDSTDLTDFFLDPKIGQETLEQKRATAAFSTEAIRRAGQGIAFDATRFEQTAAGLLGLGLNEAQIGASAAQGFENIAQRLKPTAKLASIYERMPTSELTEVQKELEAEEFKGTASERRKRLEQREIAEFTGQSGTARGVSLSRSRAGII